MKVALEEARKAFAIGEVPVGAILVMNGEIIARDHNRRETFGDATAHAEILVLQKACRRVGGWRLSGTTIYVTLEPCPMCAGALVQARVDRLVYAADDPKAGAVNSLYNLVQDERLNHRMEVAAGFLNTESSELLKRFFKMRRS